MWVRTKVQVIFDLPSYKFLDTTNPESNIDNLFMNEGIDQNSIFLVFIDIKKRFGGSAEP